MSTLFSHIARMLYRFLRLLFLFYIKIHVKRVFVKGSGNVPEGGPVIFAANHGNAFLDAIMLLLILNRPIWYLARADVFKTAWQRWILRQLHLIPVYRMRDGIDSIVQNKFTFELCSKLMQEGKALLIFSEGNAVPENRLRPLKKGTARIAVQAAKSMNWPADFNIIPLGINYASHTQFRTEIMIGFGQAIKLNEFKSIYESDNAIGLKSITHAIYRGIIEEMVHIPERDQDNFAFVALSLARGEKQYPFFKYRFDEEGRLDHERAVLANFIEKDSPELRDKLARFAKRSRELHLPLSLAYSRIPDSRTWFLVWAFLPAVIGAIFHAVPMSLAFWFTGKSVKDPQFVSSVLIGTGFILNFIWYLIFICVSIIISPWILVGVFILPIMGRITLIYSEALSQQRARSLRLKMD
jgi:1-acyl-sn-glycerol-3-phosphate acyltransferase